MITKKDIDKVRELESFLSNPINAMEERLSLKEYLDGIPIEQRTFPLITPLERELKTDIRLNTYRSILQAMKKTEIVAYDMQATITRQSIGNRPTETMEVIASEECYKGQRDYYKRLIASESEERGNKRREHDEMLLTPIDNATVKGSPRPFQGRERLAVINARDARAQYETISDSNGIFLHYALKVKTEESEQVPIGYNKILTLVDSTCSKGFELPDSCITSIDISLNSKAMIKHIDCKCRQLSRQRGEVKKRGKRGAKKHKLA